MPEQKPNTIRRETFIEKIIRRSLETVGGSVDRLFGRGRKPDALPNTSDLGERVRKLIDSRAQINKDGRKLAPHLIRIKYAWGQASDEFLHALKKLENELLIIAVDHINDNRYATVGAVKINSKADILTEGFALTLGFDEADLNDSEAVAVPVEIYAKLLPQIAVNDFAPAPEVIVTANASFPSGKTRRAKLTATSGEKSNFVVGRVKETDLYLDDASVSKHHASLVFTADNKLMVADIGSTNGTSLDGERIAYGKAYPVKPAQTVGFGDVRVRFEWEAPIVEAPVAAARNARSDSEMTFVAGADQREFTVGVVSKNQTGAAQANDEAGGDVAFDDLETAAAPQTFIGKTAPQDERDEYKTFVDEALTENPNDEYKTFVDEKIDVSKINAKNAVDSASNSEPNDFTGILTNKSPNPKD